MYYDLTKKVFVSDSALKKRGLQLEDKEELKKLGFVEAVIEKPEYDATLYGIEPDGEPDTDSIPVIQHMRIYNLAGRLKPQMRANATSSRWAHETGGVSIWNKLPEPEVEPLEIPEDATDEEKTQLEEMHAEYVAALPRWSETRILTDIDDQNRISTALQGMRDSGIESVDFKTASGWVTLTLSELTAIEALIAKHVQACFSNERKLHEAIDAAQTVDELNAIDMDAGWPVYPMPENGNAEMS